MTKIPHGCFADQTNHSSPTVIDLRRRDNWHVNGASSKILTPGIKFSQYIGSQPRRIEKSIFGFFFGSLSPMTKKTQSSCTHWREKWKIHQIHRTFAIVWSTQNGSHLIIPKKYDDIFLLSKPLDRIKNHRPRVRNWQFQGDVSSPSQRESPPKWRDTYRFF